MSYVQLCGCLGRITPVGEAASEAHACFVWRTDRQLFGRSSKLAGTAASLYDLACDVAELYHHSFSVQLLGSGPARPWTRLEVIWLELAADDALLVFFKPVGDARLSEEASVTSAENGELNRCVHT